MSRPDTENSGIANDTAQTETVFGAMEGTLRIWPQRVRGEGHFAALLQKAGSAVGAARSMEGKTTAAASGVTWNPEGRTAVQAADVAWNREGKRAVRASASGRRNPKESSGKSGKGSPGKPDRDLEAIFSFCEENMRFPESLPLTDWQALFAAIGWAAGLEDVRLVRFGENLYLAPAMLPDLRGRKVLRPGLHLGELKKNRFEPSHALALALDPACAAHVWELEADGPLAAAYLKGQTFPAEGEKGWYLICVDGFGIGWGKLAGGIMKNHYPIGLRRKDSRNG